MKLTRNVILLLLVTAGSAFANRPRPTDLKIAEATSNHPDSLRFVVEGEDPEVVQVTKRFLLEPLLKRLCAGGPDSCETAANPNGTDIRRKWVMAELKAKVKAKILGCVAEWMKSMKTSDFARLTAAIVADPSYRQRSNLDTLSKDFADYVSRFYEGCADSTIEAAAPFMWNARGYWDQKINGDNPTIEAREYIATFSKLLDGPFDARVVTTIAAHRKAFRARVYASFQELSRIGFPEDHKFDDGALFDAIREGKAKTMAELAVLALAGYSAVEAGVDEAIRARDLARLSPVAWTTDVILGRCKSVGATIDTACGSSPQTKFRWARLRLPERSVKFLLPRWQSPETVDTVIPDLGPFLYSRNRR